MKKSMLSRVALALGLGFNDSAIHIEPQRSAPSKKQTRARSSRGLVGGNNSTPVIHNNSNAAARRLREMQRGMLNPDSRNINAKTIQANA